MLTGGRQVRDESRQTLVACSGGADSVCLAAVLASVTPRPILGHVLHDIRESSVAAADRDSVRRLATRLGCDYLERSVQIARIGGNLEHNARRARYQSLVEMANEAGVQWVATGHHGDDQLETVLMHLIRGAGMRGMSGMSAYRLLGSDDCSLIRPMLEVTRQDIEMLCQEAALDWRSDATNDDQGFLRNRIRHSVLPLLREIEPDVATRAAGFARSCEEANKLADEITRREVVARGVSSNGSWRWERNLLREQQHAVLAQLVFVYVEDEFGGAGADQIRRRGIEDFVRAVKSGDTDPSTHRLGPIIVRICAGSVMFQSAANEVEISDEKELVDE